MRVVYAWARSTYQAADRWAQSRHSRDLFILLILAWTVRSLLSPLTELFSDGQVYIYWGVMMRHHFFDFYSYGAHNSNWRFLPQYPPVAMYILCITESIYAGLSHLTGMSSQHALIAIMKIPAILADLGATVLLYRFARDVLPHKWALALAAVYGFLPPVLIDGALWGQTDAVLVLLATITLLLMLQRHPVWAGIMMGLTLMFKPQPTILLPIIIVYAWRWQGWRVVLRFLLSLAAVVVVTWLPYLLPPHPEILTYSRVVTTSINAWPATSVSAYNLWWLLDMNGVDYRVPAIGPFSTNLVGLILFAVVSVIVLIGILVDSSSARLFLAASITVVTAYNVITLQHERYIFPAIFLLLVATIHQRANAVFFAGVSTISFLNMLAPIIMYSQFGDFLVPGSQTTWRSVFAPALGQYAHAVAFANVVLLGSMLAFYLYTTYTTFLMRSPERSQTPSGLAPSVRIA